ncbi:MAG: winged helix-turn-helix transcriptional regulator [Planctomycetes bacterium]|nr:winged helix-turn-helix transcriptional regulator [Planctomycetota bacterium]
MSGARRLARMLKALSVESRVRIVLMLKGRALCVGALAARLGVTQGAVSQHLRIMRDAGLVVDEKRGCYVHYRLKRRTLARWRVAINEMLAPTCGLYKQTKGARPCVARRRRKAARSRRN